MCICLCIHPIKHLTLSFVVVQSCLFYLRGRQDCYAYNQSPYNNHMLTPSRPQQHRFSYVETRKQWNEQHFGVESSVAAGVGMANVDFVDHGFYAVNCEHIPW